MRPQTWGCMLMLWAHMRPPIFGPVPKLLFAVPVATQHRGNHLPRLLSSGPALAARCISQHFASQPDICFPASLISTHCIQRGMAGDNVRFGSSFHVRDGASGLPTLQARAAVWANNQPVGPEAHPLTSAFDKHGTCVEVGGGVANALNTAPTSALHVVLCLVACDPPGPRISNSPTLGPSRMTRVNVLQVGARGRSGRADLRTFDVELHRDLVDAAGLGDLVTVSGVVYCTVLQPDAPPRQVYCSLCAHHIRREPRVQATPDERRACHALRAEEPCPLSLLANSLGPCVPGDEVLKAVLCLALVGGCPIRRSDGLQSPGTINVLIVGEAAVGKSFVLENVVQVLPSHTLLLVRLCPLAMLVYLNAPHLLRHPRTALPRVCCLKCEIVVQRVCSAAVLCRLMMHHRIQLSGGGGGG